MRTPIEFAILFVVFGTLAVFATVAAARARGSSRTRNQQGLTEEDCLENARPHDPWVTICRDPYFNWPEQDSGEKR